MKFLRKANIKTINIASTFQTKEELINNLSSAGFNNILIEDVDDIYRISTATKE